MGETERMHMLIRRARDFGTLRSRGVNALPWTVNLADDFDVAHAVSFDVGLADFIVELDAERTAAIADSYRAAFA